MQLNFSLKSWHSATWLVHLGKSRFPLKNLLFHSSGRGRGRVKTGLISDYNCVNKHCMCPRISICISLWLEVQVVKSQSCPLDWIEGPRNNCYKFVYNPKQTWANAQAKCVEEDANLIAIDSLEEVYFIRGYRSYNFDVEQDIWIGGYQEDERYVKSWGYLAHLTRFLETSNHRKRSTLQRNWDRTRLCPAEGAINHAGKYYWPFL